MVAGVMREVGSGVRQDIEVLASVSRGCQESGSARSVPREECAKGWAAGGLAGRGELAGDFIRASCRKRI